MKAIILAAGKGERLGNITNEIPKPMLRHLGKPILQHNIELCKSNGIRDIYINVHHLSNQIIDYFKDGSAFGVKITYSVEEELFGTAGATQRIKKVFWEKIADSIDPFFVIYGDNFSAYPIIELINIQHKTKSDVVIGCHYREDVSTSGVAEIEPDGRITRFIEKPKPGESKSHWVNAGVYYLTSTVFNFIPEGYSDFAKDIFPKMISEKFPLYSFQDFSDLKAFDTPEMLKKNLSE